MTPAPFHSLATPRDKQPSPHTPSQPLLALSLSADGTTKTYTVTGPFFFASDRAFKNYFTTSADPAMVIIDCTGAQMHDYSAVAALNSLGERYAASNKTCSVKVQGRHSIQLVELLGRRLRNVNVEIVADGHLVQMTPDVAEITLDVGDIPPTAARKGNIEQLDMGAELVEQDETSEVIAV